MKYRLTINPAVESSRQLVTSFEYEEKKVMDIAASNMADLLLFLQDDIAVMNDFSNIFEKQENVNGEWVTIDDDEHG